MCETVASLASSGCGAASRRYVVPHAMDEAELETLLFSSYNAEQRGKLCFADVHPRYRKEEDSWGKCQYAYKMFVPTCVRTDFLFS